MSPHPRSPFTALLALAGCGRLGFEAIPVTGDGSATADSAIDSTPFVCTPLGHDEDSDGLDDACDVCPHLYDPLQPDTDGDRVGDQCDLDPTNPRQQILLFDGFGATLAAPWSIGFGPVSLINDELVLDAIGVGRSIYRPYTQGEDWIVVSATTGTAGPGDHLLSVVTSENTGNRGFYCEMFYDSSSSEVLTMFTYSLDGSTFLHDGVDAWTQPLTGGGGTFEYLLVGPNARCRSAWLGDVHLVEGTWPTAITPERLTLYAENIQVQIQWVVVIRTI